MVDTGNDGDGKRDVGEAQLGKEVELYIAEQVKADKFSGVVLVAKGSEIITEVAVGQANHETGTPNTVETRFNLGSCNKMFTSVAVAQLVEKGQIRFDGKVGEYLPDFPNKDVADNVTVHQLLTHTSGMGHFLRDKARFRQVRENLRTIDDFVNLFKDEPLEFRPGDKYSYSANGFELLGAIIEKVSGKSYYEYVKENIFDKAGMDNSGFEVDSNSAVGYTNKDDDGNPVLEDRRTNIDLNFIKAGAGGSGYTTVHDLLAFSQALWGNKLLSEEMTKVVASPKVEVGTKNGETLYYGYGFQILKMGEKWRVGHGGEFFGVSARFDTYPSSGYTVVSLSNYDAPAAHRVAEKVKEWIVTVSFEAVRVL